MQLRATRLTAIAHAVRRAIASFSPASLFAANEPGVWYDPSDLTTMFQDAAGTTPVTAVEQPVGLLLDKSRGLVLGPEKGINPGSPFVATTGFAGNAPGTTAVSVVGGNLRTSVSEPYGRSNYELTGLTVGKTYKVVINALASTGEWYIDTVGGFSGGIAQSKLARVITFYKTASATTANILLIGIDVSPFDISSISVRELPGAHASQTTATSRPVLSARINQLVKTEQFDDAVWTSTGSGGYRQNIDVITPGLLAPDGNTTGWTVGGTTESAKNYGKGWSRLPSVITNAGNRISFFLKYTNTQFVGLIFNDVEFSYRYDVAVFDIVNGTVDGLQTYRSPTEITIENAGNGWFKCSFTSQITSRFLAVGVLLLPSGAGNTFGANGVAISVTPAGASVGIWGASLVPANQASLPYQRVNTATDYDAGPLFPKSLRFDGIDDSLVTPTITPGVDKAQIFAGVRKLSDAANYSVIVEFGNRASNQPGSFTIHAPGVAGTGSYVFNAQGTSGAVDGAAYSATTFVSPITNVLSCGMDIAGNGVVNEVFPRVNAAVPTLTVVGDQNNAGTGNFLAYPLYIGRRGSAILPFNGHIHSMIVRFGPTLTADQITQTEQWVNSRTGAF